MVDGLWDHCYTPAMQCPICGHDIQPDFKFCTKCGSELALVCQHCGVTTQPGARFCSQCGHPITAQTVQVCPNCDHVNLQDSAFRNTCGAALTGSADSLSTPFPAPPTTRETADIGTDLFDNPFRRLRARRLLLWGLVSIPIGIVTLLLAKARYDLDFEDPTVYTIAFNVWLYGAILVWVLWQFVRRRVDIRRIIGHVPSGYRWLPAVGIIVATALFSMGALRDFYG